MKRIILQRILIDDSHIISDIPLHEWLNLKIEVTSDHYLFTANDHIKEVWANISQKYNSTCSYNRTFELRLMVWRNIAPPML